MPHGDYRRRVLQARLRRQVGAEMGATTFSLARIKIEGIPSTTDSARTISNGQLYSLVHEGEHPAHEKGSSSLESTSELKCELLLQVHGVLATMSCEGAEEVSSVSYIDRNKPLTGFNKARPWHQLHDVWHGTFAGHL